MLYRYIGAELRTFPDLPVTPSPGDVADWGEITPDPLFWEPAPKARNVRPNDNADPEAEVPAEPGLDVPTEPTIPSATAPAPSDVQE